MALEDTDQIDIVTAPDADGKVELVIVDAGVTTKPKLRRELLLEKVNLYFQAVRSGYFSKQHPKLKTSDYRIKVVCFTPPTPGMFEVTHIRSKTQPEHHMEVHFEQPDGRPWPGAKFALSENPKSIPAPSAKLRKLAESALEFGFETIRDKCFYVCASWLEGKENRIAAMAIPDSQAALLCAQEQAAAFPAKVSHHVIVYDALITKNGKQQDAVMARACERRRPKGILFALEYTPGKGRQKAKRSGTPYIIGECENDLEPTGGPRRKKRRKA